MNKLIKRIKVLVGKRTFWINALGGAALVLNQAMPFLPAEYIAGATVAATLVNRFLKVITEEKTEEKKS